MAALVARDLVLRSLRGAMRRLHDEPELRPLLERLPDEVRGLFKKGEPAWSGALARPKREAPLRALLEMLDQA